MKIRPIAFLSMLAAASACSAPVAKEISEETTATTTIVDVPVPGSTALSSNAAAMDDDAQPDEPVVETNAP